MGGSKWDGQWEALCSLWLLWCCTPESPHPVHPAPSKSHELPHQESIRQDGDCAGPGHGSSLPCCSCTSSRLPRSSCKCLLCCEGEQTEKPSCGLKIRVFVCSGVFLWFGFSLRYHPVELLGVFGVTPCWEDTGLWWLRLAGLSPNHGGHTHWCLLGFCSMVSWAVPSSSSRPILAWLEATRNVSGFVLHLQFRALFLLGVQEHWPGWPGWGQGELAQGSCCWPCHLQ